MDSYDYSFSNWRKPQMARGQFMLGGVAVVISEGIPKQHIADEIIAIRRGFFIRGVRAMLGLSDWPVGFRSGAKIERDQAIMAAGKIFMTRALWNEFNQQTCA